MKTNNVDTLSMIGALTDNAIEIFEPKRNLMSFQDYMLMTSVKYALVQLDLLNTNSLKQTKEAIISKKFFS